MFLRCGVSWHSQSLELHPSEDGLPFNNKVSRYWAGHPTYTVNDCARNFSASVGSLQDKSESWRSDGWMVQRRGQGVEKRFEEAGKTLDRHFKELHEKIDGLDNKVNKKVEGRTR